ncbi:MAG: hypothetical protein CMQ85_02290 [Gammaproteobacteria bacterium]|nr:hypothetical protein [Gammaproteobacteria bacterium]|tara:strand:+ start:925 stop:1620 length:696 start_codon:yes stop_codon:yes gene_type:complete
MTLRNKNKTTKKQLKKEDVLHYLSENPNFISDNIDLFNKIFSLNRNNGNIISFEDIRIKSLIKENNEIKKKIKEIVESAKNNKKIQEKLSKFSNEVISFRKINLLVDYIEDFIDKEFSSVEIKFNLIKFNGFSDLDNSYFTSDKNFLSLINNTFIEKKPFLISIDSIEKYSLGKYIKKKDSVVVCPLGIEYPIGVIFVKYKSEMMGLDLQFDLLNSLAETISYSLEQYIQK